MRTKTTPWTVRAEISNFPHFTFDFSKFKMSVTGLKICFAEPSDKMSDDFEFGSNKISDNVR